MPTKQIQPSIAFHFLSKDFSLRNRSPLKFFVAGIFRKEKKQCSDLQYIFCSDKYLLEINRQFLSHDYYTDIITFNLSDKNQPINAEIYVSVDRVKDNAQNFNNTFSRELHRVIFHGVLHLCGYKDKTKKEKEMMRKMEDKYLDAYFA